jgi:hypothetical protein
MPGGDRTGPSGKDTGTGRGKGLGRGKGRGRRVKRKLCKPKLRRNSS